MSAQQCVRRFKSKFANECAVAFVEFSLLAAIFSLIMFSAIEAGRLTLAYTLTKRTMRECLREFVADDRFFAVKNPWQRDESVEWDNFKTARTELISCVKNNPVMAAFGGKKWMPVYTVDVVNKVPTIFEQSEKGVAFLPASFGAILSKNDTVSINDLLHSSYVCADVARISAINPDAPPINCPGSTSTVDFNSVTMQDLYFQYPVEMVAGFKLDGTLSQFFKDEIIIRTAAYPRLRVNVNIPPPQCTLPPGFTTESINPCWKKGADGKANEMPLWKFDANKEPYKVSGEYFKPTWVMCLAGPTCVSTDVLHSVLMGMAKEKFPNTQVLWGIQAPELDPVGCMLHSGYHAGDTFNPGLCLGVAC